MYLKDTNTKLEEVFLLETRMKHVLLEVYYEDGLDIEKMLTEGATFDEYKEKDIKFTYADYELCFAGEAGIVQSLEDFIGFGGEMDIDPDINKINYQVHSDRLKTEWEKISRKKIEEAYMDYMLFKNKYVEENGIVEDTID